MSENLFGLTVAADKGLDDCSANAPKADTYVVFAVTTPDIGSRGISAFIVEKGWKGFEFGDHYDKMGIRSSSTAELIFNDVKVPKENLLGK